MPGSYTPPVEDYGEYSVDGSAHGYQCESGSAGRAVCTTLGSIDVHERGNQPEEGVDQPSGEEVDIEPIGIV
jgi:hypothetical protein